MVWMGGSIGSAGGRSGIEWMLSIGGIGVDASGPSTGRLGLSSAICFGCNCGNPGGVLAIIVLSRRVSKYAPLENC